MDDQPNTQTKTRPSFWVIALWLMACFLAIVLPPFFTKTTILATVNNTDDLQTRVSLLVRASAITPWDQKLSSAVAELLADSPVRVVQTLGSQASLGWLSPSAEIIYAQSLDKIGEMSRAVTTFEKLDRVGTLDEDGTLYLASIYHRQANFAMEWKILQEVYAKHPNNKHIGWRIYLLMVAFGVDNDIKVQVPIDINPDAIKRLQNAASQPEPFSRAISSGIALMGMGEKKLAQLCFERAAQIQPSMADAWAWLAISKVESDNPLPARMAFSRALRAEEKSKQFLYLAGQYYLASAQPKLAAKAFQQATQTEPNASGAWMGYGLSIADENLVSSLAALQKASELAPFDPEVWRAIAEVCLRNESYIHQTAIPAIDQLIALRPDDPRARILRARAMIATNDLSGALDSLDIAKNLARSDDLHAEILFYKGWLYYLQGDLPSSGVTFGILLDQYPLDPFAQEAEALLGQVKSSVR